MANRPRITDLEEFAHLDAELTMDQLAERYGCNVETIRRTRARIGLPPRRPRLSTERKTRIEARLADGWSHAEIARTEGVSADTLARHYPGTAWSKREVMRHAITASYYARQKGLRIAG